MDWKKEESLFIVLQNCHFLLDKEKGVWFEVVKSWEDCVVAGESDSKSVLDAFFLGKALAEALNERIESSVGEFLSTIGRLQAEQQKQVVEFQVSKFKLHVLDTIHELFLSHLLVP